jgi:energy-coupling factor transport system substrate-specific component
VSRKHYFTTKDLVIIALLGAIGAALSTYVGYLAKAVGSAMGLPFGGQMLTGLHVFWLVLVLALVDKKGAGLVAAILDNVVQFMMGSHLGVFVLPVGLLQGIFVELGYWPLKRFSRTLAFMVAGGLSAWSNLLVVHFALNMFGGKGLFRAVSLVAFASGIVFAGLLALGVVKILESAGLVRRKKVAALQREAAPSTATES